MLIFDFGVMNYNTTLLEGDLEAAECGKPHKTENSVLNYQVYMHVITVSL